MSESTWWVHALHPRAAVLHVVGIAGWSGAGKTTLIERLIPILRDAGHWVATVKHAHCGFDLDTPGKDSWRHRQAGACEVVVASDRRVAVIREAPVAVNRRIDDLLKELSPPTGTTSAWVLVEGFHQDRIPTIEVWRAALNKPLRAHDDTLQAIATTDPAPAAMAHALALPHAQAQAHLPMLDLDDPQAIVAHLLSSAPRFRRTWADDAAPVTAHTSAVRIAVQPQAHAASPLHP